MKIPIPKPLSGGLILSYRRSAACRIVCMPVPKLDSDWIREEDLTTIFHVFQQDNFVPNLVPLHFNLDIRKHLVMIDSFEELAPLQFYKHVDSKWNIT